MLSELTALKLDAALLELELLQRTGDPDAPAPGEPGILAWLARRAGLSEGTLCAFQRHSLVRVARALRTDEGELPTRLASAFCHLIDNPEQPELF
jgi:hypothetical protein